MNSIKWVRIVKKAFKIKKKCFLRRESNPRPGKEFFSILKAFLTILTNSIEFSEFFYEFRPIIVKFLKK